MCLWIMGLWCWLVIPITMLIGVHIVENKDVLTASKMLGFEK